MARPEAIEIPRDQYGNFPANSTQFAQIKAYRPDLQTVEDDHYQKISRLMLPFSCTQILNHDYVNNVKNKRNNLAEVVVLDIGAANGANDIKLVKEGGVLILANDNPGALLDLANFRSRLTAQEKMRVYFNTDSFPDKLNQQDDTFDAVLMSHVAHYLTGPQIRNGFKKIYLWLKPEGKLFFQALTPYSLPYSWRAKTADILLRLGHIWPGWYGQEPKQIEYEFGTKLLDPNGPDFPKFGHPLHAKILARELKAAGFEIEYIGYSDFSQSFESPLTYQEHEFYVMSECENDAKIKEDKTKRDAIARKIANNISIKNALDEGRISYCRQKKLQKKDGYSLQQKINFGLKSIAEARDKIKTKKLGWNKHGVEKVHALLLKAQEALIKLQDQKIIDSTEKVLEDLTQEMFSELGEDFRRAGDNANPLYNYYNSVGAIIVLKTMKTIQAIAKKPKS